VRRVLRLEFEGKVACIHHIYKGLGGDFHVPLDHRRRYSVLDIKVGQGEVTIIRLMNSRKLREWKGWPGEEVGSGDKVRVMIERIGRHRKESSEPFRATFRRVGEQGQFATIHLPARVGKLKK
jgi:hypothetical protein